MFPSLRLAMEGFSAFEKDQREWIRDVRDNGKCQFPEHQGANQKFCNGRLEVHHILGQRWCYHLHIDPDIPTNAVTICQEAHQKIHPDMAEARREYGVDRLSYQKKFQAREESLNEGKIYWVDKWDRSLTGIAIRNTQKAEREGKHFPEKKSKPQLKQLTLKTR